MKEVVFPATRPGAPIAVPYYPLGAPAGDSKPAAVMRWAFSLGEHGHLTENPGARRPDTSFTGFGNRSPNWVVRSRSSRGGKGQGLRARSCFPLDGALDLARNPASKAQITTKIALELRRHPQNILRTENKSCTLAAYRRKRPLPAIALANPDPIGATDGPSRITCR